MKASELMIGDWVDRFNKPPYYRVVVINSATTEVHISETGEDDDTKRIVWDDKLDPIPLTPEILEKNGFINEPKGVLYNYVLPKEKHLLVFECSVLEGTLFQTLVIKYQREFDYIKEYDVTEDVHIHIKYVHQLQHALKLCGIDKEIVL